VFTLKRARMFTASLLLVSILLPRVRPVYAAPQNVDVLTVGAVIGGAFLAKGLVGDLLDDASGEVKEILAEVDEMLNDLIDELGATYEDLLDVTLDQLDAFTRDQLLRLNSMIQRLQADLQVGLDQLNETILEDLRFITTQARTIVAQLEDVVAVAVGGALIIVDKTAFNLAFLVALVLLGLGLIAIIWLLFTRRLPREVTSRRLALTGMGAFVLVFGGLLLPQGRAYALTWSGLGRRVEELVEPRIFQVTPETLVLGRTREIALLGARLAPEGIAPTVEIAGTAVAVAAASNEIVVVDVSQANLGASIGSQTIRLVTAAPEGGAPQVATAAITIQESRPLPSVVSWTITPLGNVYEQGGNATVTEVGCRSSGGTKTTTGSCHEEVEIRVDTANGFVLDPSVPATLGTVPGSGNTLTNSGDATYGFTETITTYEERNPRRNIRLLDEGTRIVGIVVSASAQSDTRHPITNSARNRGEFRGTYTVFGRRLREDVPAPVWTFSGTCPISGTVVCGTYPYPQDLARFVDGHLFLVQVTFRGADGELVARSDALIPNDPSSSISAPLRYEDENGRLTGATYELTILDSSVSVFGPDLGVTLPPMFSEQINEALEQRSRCPFFLCP